MRPYFCTTKMCQFCSFTRFPCWECYSYFHFCHRIRLCSCVVFISRSSVLVAASGIRGFFEPTTQQWTAVIKKTRFWRSKNIWTHKRFCDLTIASCWSWMLWYMLLYLQGDVDARDRILRGPTFCWLLGLEAPSGLTVSDNLWVCKDHRLTALSSVKVKAVASLGVLQSLL